LHGYKQHKNILLDVIDYVYPEANALIQTNAHERVEVVLQTFIKNVPQNISKTEPDGMILHLVNLTGFSGNTYFASLPIRDLTFTINLGFKPKTISGMVNQSNIDFTWSDGVVKFSVKELGDFEGIIVER